MRRTRHAAHPAVVCPLWFVSPRRPVPITRRRKFAPPRHMAKYGFNSRGGRRALATDRTNDRTNERTNERTALSPHARDRPRPRPRPCPRPQLRLGALVVCCLRRCPTTRSYTRTSRDNTDVKGESFTRGTARVCCCCCVLFLLLFLLLLLCVVVVVVC